MTRLRHCVLICGMKSPEGVRRKYQKCFQVELTGTMDYEMLRGTLGLAVSYIR